MTQATLFDEGPIKSSIEGLVYEPEFLSPDEEKELIEIIKTLPLHAARYKQYVARRRVVSFGGSYDFDVNRLLPGIQLDGRLHELRDRVEEWLGVPPGDLVHALVAEYEPGTPLGWHRDVPDFEMIVGVSLGGHATLRFRPYPDAPTTRKVVQLDVAPRSIYKLAGEARWLRRASCGGPLPSGLDGCEPPDSEIPRETAMQRLLSFAYRSRMSTIGQKRSFNSRTRHEVQYV